MGERIEPRTAGMAKSGFDDNTSVRNDLWGKSSYVGGLATSMSRPWQRVGIRIAGSFGGTSAYPAVISIPENTDRSILRLGTSGTATVFADNAGVIGLIAWILLWVQSYTAYL